MWVFILAELLVFGIFFAAYAFARSAHPELFDRYQANLDRTGGLVNTLLLITGSYFAVRAVAAIRKGATAACQRWMVAALTAGAAFLVVKGGELVGHYSEGVRLSSNTFYMFYLSLTVFHYMHVIMGMVILAAVAAKARAGAYSVDEHTGVETGAAYWHMVDLVWLILFPLVYVMR
ncbi:cytochrome c oxidase subunit 3 [Thiohalorhabdus sp.]|uniref:cytochrome c oxidase subunit 3 n=1 Tax=Thiohalorhabdus sp. TaxID=3094134 RepID=UPI003FCD157C